MKAETKIIFTLMLFCTTVFPAMGAQPFPKIADVMLLQPGELASNSRTFQIGEKVYAADYGYLAVPENRKNPIRTLHLEVVRIHSTNPVPAEPVFLLAGGPGDPNVYTQKDFAKKKIVEPYSYILEDHDFVMIGYRGIDFLETEDVKFSGVSRALRTRGPLLDDEHIEGVNHALQENFDEIAARGVHIPSYTAVEVIEDFEAARDALGYDRINLYSLSYGSRVAYLYGRTHPESLNRTIMVGANPPGGFVSDPEMLENVLNRYAATWSRDPAVASRAPDIKQTMEDVLETLPRNWFGIRIEPDKVKAVTQVLLYYQTGAAQVFDAYVAAAEGDYSGLAMMSALSNMAFPRLLSFDLLTKGYSLDYDPEFDYHGLDSTEYIIDPVLSALAWTSVRHDTLTVSQVPPEYRRLEKSAADTLIVNGRLDMSTPPENAETMHAALPNSELVMLDNMGHCTDIEHLQPEAFGRLITGYFEEGRVDDSGFKPQSVNFVPETTFQRQAKVFMFGTASIGAMVLGGLVTTAVMLLGN